MLPVGDEADHKVVRCLGLVHLPIDVWIAGRL